MFDITETVRMRLVLVHVYHDVPGDRVEKFASVLNAVSGVCACRPCRDRLFDVIRDTQKQLQV